MLFAALTNSVCLNNASFFFLFKYFLCQGYELSGEIALKNNHYYYYYYYYYYSLRCKESLAGFLDAFVRCVKQIRHCGSNGLFLLLIKPY